MIIPDWQMFLFVQERKLHRTIPADLYIQLHKAKFRSIRHTGSVRSAKRRFRDYSYAVSLAGSSPETHSPSSVLIPNMISRRRSAYGNLWKSVSYQR